MRCVLGCQDGSYSRPRVVSGDVKPGLRYWDGTVSFDVRNGLRTRHLDC